MSFTITLSSNASRILRQVGGLLPEMQGEIRKELNLQNSATVGVAQRRYLTGPRPGKLGVVTNRLRGSLYVGLAKVSGNEVLSSFGTNVEYAGIHERGFKGPVAVRQHRRRIIAFDRYERRGRGFTQTQSGIKGTIKAHTRQVDMPARPFLAPALSDRAEQYNRAISRGIVRAWRNSAS